MFNVCPQCGLYSEDKVIEPKDDPYGIALAVCLHCGYGHPFRRHPLFVLTGASGSGKTAICVELTRAQLAGAAWVPECVFLEQDILWRDEFVDPQHGYRGFRNMWLRVAKNVGQCGWPVVLFGSAVPEQCEACPERRYFAAIHYLALVCDDDLLLQRLQDRPGWRGSSDAAFLDRMVGFSHWLQENAQHTRPPMSLLDTTGPSVRRSAEKVASWIRAYLPRR